MINKEENNSREIYGTILNGWVDFENSASNPLARKEVRYYNPSADKMQTQNYLDMQDIAVPVILRKNQNGELEFAMQYEYIPSINKVLLELPDCPLKDKKGSYTNAEVTYAIDNRMRNLGLEMIGFKYLDASETAVSQSFTDQQAKFVAVYVEEKGENEQLQWFSITSLLDYFKNIGINSSLQTKYALLLFFSQYREEISKEAHTNFEYDKDIVGNSTGKWQGKKNIMEHKYRFGIELAENETKDEVTLNNNKIPNLGQYAEYGLSKNSVQCLITKREKGKWKIGLSKQQRSPFVEREGVEEYFYEAAAGMVEPGESYIDAAKREVVEETGIKIVASKLIHISEPTILSKATQEYSDFYLYLLENSRNIGKQQLDLEEDIGEIEWFDLDGSDFQKMHIPLTTKYMIEIFKDLIKRELLKEQPDGELEL